MQRADKLQDELIALEKLYRSRHDPLMIVESIEVTPSDPWIDYHDQLIKEWFDGEKTLIDDLYPATKTEPPRAREPRETALSRAGADLAEFGRVLAGVVVITALVVWANWIMQIFVWR